MSVSKQAKDTRLNKIEHAKIEILDTCRHEADQHPNIQVEMLLLTRVSCCEEKSTKNIISKKKMKKIYENGNK